MERVKRVVIKNARGHALYELDRGMSFEADDFFAIPLQILTPEQRDEFETIGATGELLGWSEVGTLRFHRQCGTAQSDMMGPWVIGKMACTGTRSWTEKTTVYWYNP